MRNTLSTLAVAALLAGGCAHSVKEIARESSRAAVDESVDELTDEDSKQQLAAAAEDPRVEQAVSNITDQIMDGVIKSLESDRTHKQLQSITSSAARTISRELLASLASPEAHAQIQQLTSSMAEGAIDNLGESLKTSFVPGVREALEHDLAAGAAGGLTGPLHDALGATAQNVAYNAVLGADQGLRSSWLGDTGQDLRSFASVGMPWLRLGIWGLGLLALSMLCAALIVIARARQARSEVMRLETATLLLATAMHERHAGNETDELVSVVRDAMEKSAQERQRHGLLGMLRLRHR